MYKGISPTFSLLIAIYVTHHIFRFFSIIFFRNGNWIFPINVKYLAKYLGRWAKGVIISSMLCVFLWKELTQSLREHPARDFTNGNLAGFQVGKSTPENLEQGGPVNGDPTWIGEAGGRLIWSGPAIGADSLFLSLGRWAIPTSGRRGGELRSCPFNVK